MDLKISSLVDSPSPLSCNFKKECRPALIYDEVIQNGLIIKELYYSDKNKTDLVVEVNIEYVYGLDTLVNEMKFTKKYYYEDDTYDTESTVIDEKVLTNRQKLSLLVKRRKTISESAKAAVLLLLSHSYPSESPQTLLTWGGSFLITNKYALEIYEGVGSLQIVSDIQNATDPWLDAKPAMLKGATIRQYLMGAFSV